MKPTTCLIFNALKDAVLWYHWKDIGKPIFLAAIKPLITEFGIDHRLESYGQQREVVAIHINFFCLS